jgi:5S rRNA maturation endonuclease (ribonuclease M5)
MNNIPQTYNGKSLVHAWTYCAKDGAPLGVVCRYQGLVGKKDIVPFFKPNGSNFSAGIALNPRPLFGLDKLASHPKDRAVFVVEGERCASAINGLGFCAVTSFGEANAAHKTDWSPLNGVKKIIIIPDNDISGENYARDVYRELKKLDDFPAVTIAKLLGLREGADIVDWLQGLVPNWDGFGIFPEIEKKMVVNQFKEEMKNIVDIPKEWNLTIIAGSRPGVFWEKPNDIETKIPPVLALSPELIPEPFRNWLADLSLRMQTPPDFAAISSLVIIGSIIGAGCSIRPKKLDDWEIVPNLWGAAIGRPSVVLKTPSMKEPMSLLERLQAEYEEQYVKDKVASEFDEMAKKALVDDVKGRLSKAAKGNMKDGFVKGDDIQKLKMDFMQLSESIEPEAIRRLFKTNETSVQSMTVLQNQNSRGLLTFRDELTAILVKWDREDGADERAYFLEGWNGNGSYTDFKVGRGLTQANNVCISLLGGIQPDKLRRYLYQAQNGSNDGLVQRLQLAVWPDEPKHWCLIDTIPNKTEKLRAFAIMKTLAELDFIGFGAVQSENDDRPYFRFDNAGQAVFNEWLTKLQIIKIQQETNPLMVEHFGKFRSLMPSLALIFHCIDIADANVQGDVSEQSALLAVDWCNYLESHARRIYAMAESPEHEAAVRLSEKIKLGAIANSFTSKTIYDKGWHGLKEKQEVEAACNILIEENWLMMTRKPPSGNRGRPPLPEYQINPIFL